MASSGTGLGLMVAAAGAWSAGLAAFALRRAIRELPDGPRRRWLRTAVPLVYATVSIVGFGIGVALSGGSPGQRLGLGFVGVALAWLLLWFIVVATLAARAVWATAHHAERSGRSRRPATSCAEPTSPPRVWWPGWSRSCRRGSMVR